MTTEHILLAGWPLPRLLQHAQTRAPGLDPAALVRAWRDARTALQHLAERESGCADDAGMLPLPAAMAPQAERLLAGAALQRAHRDVPVALGLVEADALMTLRHVLAEPRLAALRQQVGAGLDDPALAALCLPSAPASPAAAVVALRSGDTEFSFLAEDDSLQLLPADLLATDTLATIAAPGQALAGLALLVGQPHPVLHALKIGGRLLLVNGHHRAQVLRASGARFLPCLVSACDDLDDAALAAPGLDHAALAACVAAARPPMLRDFDRPALVYRHSAPAMRCLLRLRLELSRHWLP